jgi:hypothetical protein
MKMSDDYAKGFKDGFAAGLEEGKKLAPKTTRLDDYVFGNNYGCPKCGKVFMSAQVCYTSGCPYTAVAYSDGAVGATYDNMSSSYPDWAGNPTIAQSDK